MTVYATVPWAGQRATVQTEAGRVGSGTAAPPAPVAPRLKPTPKPKRKPARTSTAPAKPTGQAKPKRVARPRPTPASTVTLAGLGIVQDPIPFAASRLQEMRAYNRRHYGVDSATLAPRTIVLHFTAGGSFAGARATFAADTPNRGELPGTCAHFVVDQDGTVYQLVPLTISCRHTIGLNELAIGIEMVQSDAGHGSAWADRQILARRAQIGSVVRLVKALQRRYAISTADVIGHAMANAYGRFRDREGWTNDHSDWQTGDVAVVRRLLGS